jgi:serine/threonine protein kinase
MFTVYHIIYYNRSHPVAGVVREIAVLRRLTGHPGALSLIDLSEGPGHYHLVTELCTGGELFDQIIGR